MFTNTSGLVAIGVPPAVAGVIGMKVESNVVAAGTSISGAKATTGDIVHVGSTSASATDGIKLRVPSETQRMQVIINRGVSPCKVYAPNSDSYINGLAKGASYTLSAGQSAILAHIGTNIVGSATQYVIASMP